MPALPFDDVAINGEARAVSLDDLQRLQVGPNVRIAAEFARFRRNRHDTVVLHPQYFKPVEIDEADYSVDGMRPLVLFTVGPDERQSASEPALQLFGMAEVARGPRIDLNRGEVGHTTPGKGFLERRMNP